MSIGAYILIKSEPDPNAVLYQGLPVDLECAVTELRVEEHLSRRSSFAFRMQEDFEDGEGTAITANDLRGSTGIAILVPDANDDLVCLIAGQIEGSRGEVTSGGSGSWYEVRGRDVRTVAARECTAVRVTGAVKAIATDLTSSFTTGQLHCGQEGLSFPEEWPYVFHGTKLDGLEQLANRLGYPVWLNYKLAKQPNSSVSAARETFEIKVDTYFCPSPERGEQTETSPSVLTIDDSIAGVKATLQIIGNEGVCENVINFSIDTDDETYTSVSVAGVDLETGEATRAENVQSNQEALTQDGEDHKSHDDENERRLCLTTVGNADNAAACAQAAATDAAWYVSASALTTVHMLGVVLRPHDIVEVIGGCGISGKFQVEKVTHVINAAAHWMHLDLRSNSRSLPEQFKGITNG